ncbi:agamous-like MADS-box protein AGL9 homolog isoform X5 [Corylus avellana]|uniref:agamous-like MADS-box protein AGL9 homolog isoform X5 n=1 Tax=Corylus avellana TaxID=13451 RepID=UPI00286BD585|nr:agamous-like MADS-box protein AGL9 homolog isoform X5 [Corylus avellana]
MGRGKVQLKRIEDKISRQVTFSKRKGGLMKKANELAVLCDVEVALLIFSDRGRLYEFCSTESLEEILERYRIHAEEEAAVRKRAEQEKMNLAECTDLQTSGNPLQMIQSHLDTQNIDQKSMTELTQLEKEMDAILRQIRLRKTQLMMEAVKAVHEEICFNGPANALLASTTQSIEQKNMTQLSQLERELDVILRQIIFRKELCSRSFFCLILWFYRLDYVLGFCNQLRVCNGSVTE